jgi:hypothetical protein
MKQTRNNVRKKEKNSYNYQFTSTKLVCPLERKEITRLISASILTLSLSSGGVIYHFDNLVLP